MKIVISSDIYYPMINGVAVFSRNLAMEMAKRGHKVLVLAPSISGDFKMERDREGKFRVARLPSIKMPFYPDQINDVPEAKNFFGKQLPHLLYKNGLRVSLNPYPEIKEVLDKFKPDLIHDQTPGPVALAVYRYARRNNIPIVATSHAYPDNISDQLPLGKIGKKAFDTVAKQYFVSFLRKSEYSTTPTELAMDDLLPKKRRHFKAPVEAISNGVDLSKFGKKKPGIRLYRKYRVNPEKKTVLYVGRVDPEKNLNVLVEAFARAHREYPNSQLLIVGDGTDRPRLENDAREMGVEDAIIFAGRVIGRDLPLLYGMGDIFGITSTTETQSIVTLEAMASGLPVVAVSAGALDELVTTGKNGYLCRAGNVAEVASAISHLLNNPDDAKKMGQESRKMAKPHDITHTMNRMEEIYKEVVKNHQENPLGQDDED